MRIRPNKGLTFDDVLLMPRRSPFSSRQDVHTTTWLTPKIKLNIPIVSANMDTVTEARMAIAMAQAGGIGIIHRFMTIKQQVWQVEKVKRAEAFVVEDPYTIVQTATVAEAKQLMGKLGIGGLVVIDAEGKFAGLVTRRDIFFAERRDTAVNEIMTPRSRIISAAPDVSKEEAHSLLHKHRIEKLPLLDENGELVGLITAKDLVNPQQFPLATKDSKGRLRVGAAIGVQTADLQRAAALLRAGVDVLVLDIAHGHADHCLNMVRTLRERFPEAQIVAGNVATAVGALELAEAGADAIKVGIGPGSICTTRIVTGYGVPQLTAVSDSVSGLQEAGIDIPIIADGGIKTSGDMVKALAAGAATVMVGSLFAGCEEAPGAPVIRGGQKVKVVRGMASLGATMGRRAAENVDESAESQEDWSKVVAEGVEAVVPYRGHVRELLYQLIGGLRSGLSYGGARSIQELQETAEFIEITPAGIRESDSHDVKRL